MSITLIVLGLCKSALHLHSIHPPDLTPGDALRNNMEPKMEHDAVEQACAAAAAPTSSLYTPDH